MKTRKVIHMLIQKTFWDFDRPKEFFREGSFILDPTLEAKRVKVILRLLRIDGIMPTQRVAKIVDFCVFATKGIVEPEEHAYRLYHAIAKKFSSNLNYNKLLAKREIKKFEKDYSLMCPNACFFVRFGRKMLNNNYEDYKRASKCVDKYFANPLSEKESDEAAKMQVAYYQELYGLEE